MRTLTALVASLAMLAGWTSAEAAEARITGFVFSCETPEGRKLKPKLGDIDEAFYTDLPAQRQQCLEAIDRKIALCRDNTLFESNTKNEKYAGCLPIFREQAEVCVKHFTREQVKCGAAGPEPAEAATLNPSERQRVQAALAAEGFDPGPADGKFGPRTRRAIAAWQQANGHVATGALTEGQAESLLADAENLAPPELFGPNWIVAENQPCQVYDGQPEPGERVTWSGGCVDGKASGDGRAVWRGAYGKYVYEGEFREGKHHGHGAIIWPSGSRFEGDRFEGEFRDGRMHGHVILIWGDGRRYEGELRDGTLNGYGTYTFANGNRYEGTWHDWKPHGRGTYTKTDGTRYEGEWRDGCSGERDDRWVALFTSAAVCGFE